MKHPVIDLRTVRITNEPAVYKCWFKLDGASMLLKMLSPEIKRESLLIENGYVLLYVGKGKNANDRIINYHLLDKNKFHSKGISNGRLSSLRQTICGLMEWNMSSAQKTVDTFLDNYCAIEWSTCSISELDALEKRTIQVNYLPLNYKHTVGILTSTHRRILRESRKKHRQ